MIYLTQRLDLRPDFAIILQVVTAFQYLQSVKLVLFWVVAQLDPRCEPLSQGFQDYIVSTGRELVG